MICMDVPSIEQEASELLRMLWRDRYHLWGDQDITPLQARDPRKAALAYGFEYRELPNLGDPKFIQSGSGPKIAGLIDRQAFIKNLVTVPAAPEIRRSKPPIPLHPINRAKLSEAESCADDHASSVLV